MHNSINDNCQPTPSVPCTDKHTGHQQLINLSKLSHLVAANQLLQFLQSLVQARVLSGGCQVTDGVGVGTTLGDGGLTVVAIEWGKDSNQCFVLQCQLADGVGALCRKVLASNRHICTETLTN